MDEIVNGFAGLQVDIRHDKKVDKMARRRHELTIFAKRRELMSAVKSNQVVIVIGETGSGKTTQIPQYLMEARKAKLRSPSQGESQLQLSRDASAKKWDVGWAQRSDIPSDSKMSPGKPSEATVIRYMTDGVMLGEFLRDTDLEKYSCVVLDEAHERTINTDILFGLLWDLINRRSDLKLIISSATLDSTKFANFFQAPVFKIPGRSFPVDVIYDNTFLPVSSMNMYVPYVASKVLQIHSERKPGDILIFLTGQDDVEYCCNEIEHQAQGKFFPLKVLPLFGALPSEEQQEVFNPAPQGFRKVIVATNIAETSITIDGIVFVIDLGFVKQTSYNPKTRMNALRQEPISKASAEQRTGRAGRTGPGKCYRLFSMAFYNEMPAATVPEIQRMNLMSAALQLKNFGIDDLLGFRFMDAPSRATLLDAITDLYVLGALDRDGKPTALGEKMARFPLEPLLAKLVITSAEHGCSDEILTIVAVLSAPYYNLFLRPRKHRIEADLQKKLFHSKGGDLLSLLDVYQQWEDCDYSFEWCKSNYIQYRTLVFAKEVRRHLEGVMAQRTLRVTSCRGDTYVVRKAICAGMFLNIAQKAVVGNNYNLIIKGQSAVLHPGSSQVDVKPPFIVYSELLHTNQKFMRYVTVVEHDWLHEHWKKLLERSSFNIIDFFGDASTSDSSAAKPDASIIAAMEERVRRVASIPRSLLPARPAVI